MSLGQPIGPPELARLPLLFRETFRDRASVEKGGATLVGTGTTFSDGLVLNGSGNLLYNVSGSKILRSTMTIKIEFTLGFAANDGVDHMLYDIIKTADATMRFYILKRGTNTLYIVAANALLVEIAYATWSAALVAGKNVLVLSTTPGASSVWLNGTLIGTSATAWVAGSIRSTDMNVGCATGGSSRFIGTIHSFEIYGSVATAADEPHLRDGSIVSDIDLDKCLAYLPGKSFYKRASDSKYVTEVRGKAGITEALMGSDGLTTAQFPTVARGANLVRGFRFDGGDQINLGDSDQFSFTNGVNDLPFSVAMIVRPATLTTTSLLSKIGAGVSVGEYALYVQASGTKLLVIFLLIDNTAGKYIGRYNTGGTLLPVGQDSIVVATYSGSALSSGARIYRDGIRIDTSNLEIPGYVRMRNTANNVTLGTSTAIPAPGACITILPVIDNVEWSPMQVKSISSRLRRLARTS